MNRGTSRIAVRLAVVALVLAALGLVVWQRRARSPAASAPLPAATAKGAQPALRRAPRAAPVRLTPVITEPDATHAAGSFEGRVLSSATGHGVPGAAITFEHEGVTSSVVAGAEGAFRFEPRERGVYRLALVTAAAHLPYAPEWGHSPTAFVARAGERVRGVTLLLSPAIEYVGVVRDPMGKPIAGATVSVLERGSGSARAEAAISNAEGEARFTAADDALVEARHPSYTAARARLDFAARASRKVILKLGDAGAGADARSAGASIEGRAVDARGAAVAGALVRATFADEQPHAADLHPSPSAIADEEGRFVLEGLDAGKHDVIASSAGLGPGEAGGVAAGTKDLVLRLGAGGSVRGDVRDHASRAAVASFTVIVSARVGPLERRPFSRSAVIDAAGRYEVSGLAPGEYTIVIAAHGYAPSGEASLTVADPPGEATRDFDLDRGARVSGTVLDAASGKPIEGARVSLEGLLGGHASDVAILVEASSDAAGRFELGGLAAGLRSITVGAEGHHGRILSGLQAANDGNIGPVTVKLAPTKPGEEPRLELTGIGAVLSAKGEALLIGDTLPGGGAAEAGLVAGDEIFGVDGVPVKELGFDGAVQRIRGIEGSTVVLAVRKGGTGTPSLQAVVRRRVGA